MKGQREKRNMGKKHKTKRVFASRRKKKQQNLAANRKKGSVQSNILLVWKTWLTDWFSGYFTLELRRILLTLSVMRLAGAVWSYAKLLQCVLLEGAASHLPSLFSYLFICRHMAMLQYHGAFNWPLTNGEDSLKMCTLHFVYWWYSNFSLHKAM